VTGFGVFPDKSPHVAHAAPVEITRAGMMHGMLPPPMVIGCELEHSGDESQKNVSAPRLEKGFVGAVVENDKRPH
jgi:hypothetical protein